MNGDALKGYIITKGYNVEKLLSELEDKGITMSKNTFYRNLRSEQEFDRKEIIAIAEILKMEDSEILKIFFTEKVS